MPDRKRVISTLWFTSLLALLASVLVLPSRMPGSLSFSLNRDCVCQIFAPLSGQPPAQLSVSLTTDAVLQVSALPSDSDDNDEEQDRAIALDEPRIPFLIPCSYSKVCDRQLIEPRPILSFYPLRC